MCCHNITLLEDSERIATIGDLPPEILADIFTTITIPPNDDNDIRRPSFIPLRLVCRGWDALACSTAGLWADIRMHRLSRIEWLQLCLERSAQAPLELLFAMLLKENYTEIIPLLSRAENSRRIRRLRVRFEGVGVCPALSPLYSLVLPSLEKLETYLVNFRRSAKGWEHTIPMSFPQLHSLKLTGVSIPKDPAFYANLRSLALHANCCLKLQFTLADLAAALRSIRRLEALDLSNFEPYDIHVLHRHNLDDIVHLPYLRSYTIDNTITVCSKINRILSFPSSTILCVRVAVLSASGYGTPSDVVADIFLPSIRPSVENAVAMAVCFNDSCRYSEAFEIRIPARTHDSTDAEASRAIVKAWHWWDAHGILPFATFLPFCPSDRLTDLTLGQFAKTRPVADWATVFRTYATLERLTIAQALCDVSNVFAALTPQGLDQPEGRQELLCPALRRVDVEVHTRTNKVLRSLCGCLIKCAAARAERGARRLESLTVVWKNSKPREDAALPDDPIWERVVARLQSLVDEVAISARLR